MKKIIINGAKPLIALLIASHFFTSCAREISPDVYSADHVGETSASYPGVIVSVRQITVQDKERLEENKLGIVGGGVGGVLAGSQIGKGKGNTVAMIGGALVGATAGAFAEKALKTQQGTEYIVQLDNGELRTVVQGPQPALTSGQSVFVIVGREGRSRVINRFVP